MRVMPIRYASDVDASVRFYRALGLDLQAVSRPGGWAELTGRAGVLAVHAGSDGNAGSCELAFEADEPLEAVVGRLRAAGFACEDIVDENFGRSVRAADPDGAWVQVNEQDRELYT
jgi:catechol 2,3-dioxygenase-like lactoylglutathione lyase family enzyme